jgi:DNA polymerase-1
MKIALIDGTNVVMRYAHAMAEEKDPERVVAAAVKCIVEFCVLVETQHCIVALDSSVNPKRKELYPAYKANRTDGLTVGWSNRLHIACVGAGIACLREPGYEADDVIATVVRRIASVGHEAAVLSSDSDLLVLQSLFCTVYQFGNRRATPPEPRFAARTMAWVREKFGIPSVGALTAYKALVGEPGDNLPGVEGIGPVKARKLLAEHRDNIGVAVIAIGEEAAEQFSLMYSLVQLYDNVPLDPIVPSAIRLRPTLAAMVTP